MIRDGEDNNKFRRKCAIIGKVAFISFIEGNYGSKQNHLLVPEEERVHGRGEEDDGGEVRDGGGEDSADGAHGYRGLRVR